MAVSVDCVSAPRYSGGMDAETAGQLPATLPNNLQRASTRLPAAWELQRPTSLRFKGRAAADGPKPRSFTDPVVYPGLNWFQDTFTRVYVQTADPIVAFDAAGYEPRNPTNTKERNARHVRIVRLRNNPTVKAAMAHWSAIIESSYNASRNSVLAQLVRFGWVDPADYVDELGVPLPLHRLPRDVRMAIQDFDIVQTDQGPVHRYRFVPKLKSLELLAKVATLLDPKAADFRKQSRTRVRLRFEAGGEATVETVEG